MVQLPLDRPIAPEPIVLAEVVRISTLLVQLSSHRVRWEVSMSELDVLGFASAVEDKLAHNDRPWGM